MEDLIRWELIQNAGIELSHVVDATKTVVSGQNKDIREILTGFGELAASIDRIRTSIGEIDAAVSDNTGKSRQCATEILQTTKAMKDLESRFASVQNSLKTINTVAERTNLLALNATIEAARAGDAGRGFAVVAGEVKELSRSAQKVNNEIQETIQGVWELVSRLSGGLSQVHETITRTVSASEATMTSARNVGQSFRDAQTRITRTSGQLDEVGHSLTSAEAQLKEVSVIGTTVENLIELLGFQGVFEHKNDPLERLAPLVEASQFNKPERFTQLQCERVLEDRDILISITDPRGVITFANHKFCEIAGYKYEEIVGCPHNIIRHPDMPKAAFQDLWDQIKARHVWQGYVLNRMKSGGCYWVKATAFPCLSRTGEISGYISVRGKPRRDVLPKAMEMYRRLP